MRDASAMPTKPVGWYTRLAAVALALTLPTVAGCSAGFSAQTDQRYQPAVGVSNRSSQVYSIQTLVVTGGKGNGTLVAALINETTHPDLLVGITASNQEGQPLKTSMNPSPIPLPSLQAVQLANTTPITFSGKLIPGQYIKITYTFSQAPPLTMQIPIVPHTGYFATIPVGPPSTPSMTPLTTAPTSSGPTASTGPTSSAPTNGAPTAKNKAKGTATPGPTSTGSTTR